MYVYIESESAAETGSYPLYTVGFYAPNGGWNPESDHGGPTGKVEAAERVAWLNGQRARPREHAANERCLQSDCPQCSPVASREGGDS